MTDAERRAELAMQIVRLVQMHGRPKATLERWSHLPNLTGTLSWEGMRSRLAELPKPVLLLPGNEPGMLATWGLDQFPADQLAAAKHNFENQVGYYTEKAKVCGLAPETVLRLQKGEVFASLTVAEFIDFAREYAIGARITLGPAATPGEGVILLFGPGGHVGPITDGEAPPHEHGPECDHGH
jgi:hypothetical protein